ncbi:MAG: shikimate kinase [Opitutus sp.]
MKLVVLYGKPAVGKLTVGRELERLSNWRLFHNHLVVDALLAVFEFGSRPFVELRERIWLDVFDAASRAGTPGLIFTFSPENSVRPTFIGDLSSAAAERGDSVSWVELTCDENTAETRLANASRRATRKLTSLELYRELARSDAFNSPAMPAPVLSVATDQLGPTETAQKIWTVVGL